MKHNQIQYIEFLSNDFSAARKFYTDAFSWKFVEYGSEYLAFEGDFVSGGFAAGHPVKGSILVILYSLGLEESLKVVEDAGGSIVQNIFMFPGGRRFHFTDLEGNELAVWSDI